MLPSQFITTVSGIPGISDFMNDTPEMSFFKRLGLDLLINSKKVSIITNADWFVK